MKYVFEIAMEPSIIGTVTSTGIIAIASIIVFAPAESKPASFVAAVTIFVADKGHLGPFRVERPNRDDSKMAASLPLKVGGSSASVYESALATPKQKDHFIPKDLEDIKMNCGVRICLYPKTEVHAPAAKLSHALQVNKRAIVSSCPNVPFEEGFSVATERVGKSVEANAELRFELAKLKREIFTPANFSNENFFNSIGMPLNNAIQAADPAKIIARSIRSMRLQGNANVIRPDDIKFMTVVTTNVRGAKNISCTQLFEFPQDSAVITLANGNPRHARTYTGPDSMQMTY